MKKFEKLSIEKFELMSQQNIISEEMANKVKGGLIGVDDLCGD